jgi:hypothetical protein
LKANWIFHKQECAAGRFKVSKPVKGKIADASKQPKKGEAVILHGLADLDN